MARFPTREADIAALAGDIVHGLTEYATDFPSPPLAPADIQAALDSYIKTREAGVVAEGTAAEAFDAKDEAMQNLTEGMQAVLRYAEHAAKSDEGKLKLLGWGGRRSRTSLEAPEQVRTLEVRREGDGWTLLDWKEPVGGGKVAAFKVQFRPRKEGPWRDVGMAVETEILLNGQERGLQLEYHVIAVNKAGEGKPSNIVTVVL